MEIKKRVTLLAYSMFFFIGLFFMLPGALKFEIAESFFKDTADIQYILTFFTAGSFTSVIINKFLLERFKIKHILTICYGMAFIGIIFVKFLENFMFFGIALFILGLSAGIIMSVSNFFIISLYKDDRTKILNMLNFCYSLGSLMSPLLVIYMLKINFMWRDIYFMMLIFIVGFIIFMKFIKFEKSNEIQKSKKEKENWTIPVFLIALMMFAYVCSEMTVTYWIEEFSILKQFGKDTAKFHLSLFWIFIAIGRVITGVFTLKIKNGKFIFLFSSLALISLIIIFFSKGILFTMAIGAAGVGFSVLYATILSYGTQLKEKTATGIMTFYILSGAFGSVASSPFTGTLKKLFNINTVFVSAIVMMSIVIFIVLIVEKIKLKNI